MRKIQEIGKTTRWFFVTNDMQAPVTAPSAFVRLKVMNHRD